VADGRGRDALVVGTGVGPKAYRQALPLIVVPRAEGRPAVPGPLDPAKSREDLRRRHGPAYGRFPWRRASSQAVISPGWNRTYLPIL
jgi:hypothetical protein